MLTFLYADWLSVVFFLSQHISADVVLLHPKLNVYFMLSFYVTDSKYWNYLFDHKQ